MNKRGIIFQGVPGASRAAQLIVFDDGWYLIQDGEIADSSLPTQTISYTELDQILGLSARTIDTEARPLALEFILSSSGIELVSRGEIDEKKIQKLFRSNTARNELKGVPCAPGTVEAECLVLSSLDTRSIQDKILVLPSLEPRELPRLRNAAGLILEKGNLLSHTAVLTREMGIPCIINVKNATQRLKSGARIRMNGESGEIEFVRPQGPHEV